MPSVSSTFMTASASAASRAGLDHQRHVRLLDGGRAVDVDNHQLGAARLARPRHVGHHVDLRGDGIGAPDHDQVGILHLARIGPDQLADARQPARFGRRHADRGLLAGVAHRVAQAIEAVALQDAHVAAGVIGPDRLRARALGDAREAARRSRRALRPRRSARTGRSPWGPCGAAGPAAGRGARCARRIGRPWRKPRPACSCCRARP